MTKKQELFLQLIKSALWEQGTVKVNGDFSPEQYKSILRMATDHAVLGLVGDIVINRLDSGCPLSTKDGLEFGYLILAIKNKHKQQQSVLDNINLRLKAENIEATLLKGEGISLLYPSPTLRQCGDLDIFVGKNNFEKAMISIDEIHDINAYSHVTQKHYGCSVKDVEVEIHKFADIISFRRKKNKLFQSITDSEITKSDRYLILDQSKFKLPSQYFDAVFILQHLWNHLITGGIGFKQICDWTMVLHHIGKELDINRLEKDLKGLGLFHAWQYIGYIVVNYLGLPKDECPLYDDSDITIANSEAILQIIFDDGNFGKKSSRKGDIDRPDSYFGSKLHSLKNNFKRLQKTLQFVEKEDRLAYYLEYLRSTTERLKTKR